jgi:hypothetical protein
MTYIPFKYLTDIVIKEKPIPCVKIPRFLAEVENGRKSIFPLYGLSVNRKAYISSKWDEIKNFTDPEFNRRRFR